jgi:hypothetical protein
MGNHLSWYAVCASKHAPYMSSYSRSDGCAGQPHPAQQACSRGGHTLSGANAAKNAPPSLYCVSQHCRQTAHPCQVLMGAEGDR